MSTGLLALIILGALLAQVALATLLGIARRRREGGQPTGARHAPQAAVPPPTPRSGALASRPSSSPPAWDGFREFTVERREFEDARRTICSFYLVPVDGEPLPAFRPGQYLTFKLPIADPAGGEGRSVVRCYSLSDAPRPDHYRVSIKRVPAPADRPDLPPGLSSGFFHDHVHAGSRLLVKAPAGHFHLLEDQPLPIVLIGGGIGITPMLSILHAVLESGVRRPVSLYYGVRNGSEHIMKPQLLALARTHDNLRLHVCYSAPAADDRPGVDYQHAARVGIALLRNTLPLTRHQFYVCGPKAMMESLVPDLAAWGVDSADIHYESFGPATLTRPEKRAAVATPPGTITFRRSGRRLAWDRAAASLLEFAEANGVEVESGCRAGSCGCCQTRLLDGDVDYGQAPDAAIESGHCLLCIATPRGDLTLDA